MSRYRTRAAAEYWKNLTATGGWLRVARPPQEFDGAQSGKGSELVDEMGLIVVAAAEGQIRPSYRRRASSADRL